jgi:hypothetical protein
VLHSHFGRSGRFRVIGPVAVALLAAGLVVGVLAGTAGHPRAGRAGRARTALLATGQPGPGGLAWSDANASGGSVNLQGFDVAVSGNTAVVAAPGTSELAGSAYIYERSGSHWARAATLLDPRDTKDDLYAYAVAISATKAGTYVAIGGNNNNGNQDLVYVYTGSGRKWHLQAKIPDPGSTYEDMFGDSLAVTADILVVGASCRNSDSGGGYIYERLGPDWVLQATKIDPLGHENDEFGYSVAVSGTRVLIGAAHLAYLYTQKDGHEWPRTAELKNPGTATSNFGVSVALSGSTVVVGAPGGALNSPVPPPRTAGAAYVFTRHGATWSKPVKLTAPRADPGDEFGYSVATADSTMLIGMPFYTQGKVNCGTAFVFGLAHGVWREKTRLADQHCGSGDQFGFSVAMSGSTGLFGAPYTQADAGAWYARSLP